ncbi:MAG TPA: CbiX/SirB N-terminal domain-containing protein [Miltoncostaeaceae bacterium]|nr:CbiX/SirB N-terminal domain-containing protein [Miltoncostaeaceae bacterium]
MSDHTRTVGLIVVDHGSRRHESNVMLERMAEMIAEVVPYSIVEPAHMELAEPSIATAFGRCVERGADLVVVSPYFLLPGKHWDQDIPALTAEAASAHPGVPFLVTAPLGLHPLMAQTVSARVAHCLARVEGEADECEACAGTGRCAVRTATDAPLPAAADR